MCEIFGNYGWSEGPRMEKYLADHFMVQGVNRYVPHHSAARLTPTGTVRLISMPMETIPSIAISVRSSLT